MQRNSCPVLWSLLLFTLLAISAPTAARAQIRLADDALPAPLAGLLDEGRELESESRWADAITHYEDALKEHPGDRQIEQRLDWSKIHYDLSRRLIDRSFREAQTNIDPRRALDAYSEVLLKINAHYVTEPRWAQIVARGTTALEVALYDEDFRKDHLRGIPDERIEGFRRQLREDLGSRSIRSRHDARLAVSSVCQLAQNHLGLSATVVALEYVCGATGGLDSYSAFLTGDQLRDVYSQIEGNFVGLGIELKADKGALLLVHVIPGSPAKQAGMKSGDRIVEVDGQSTASLSTDQAASLLQGEEGTTVQVTLESPGQPIRRVEVRREHVEVPSIEDAAIIDKDFGVAYLKLTSFQKTTLRDLDTALWALHRQGMRSLIMDLRGNPGGLLTTSVEVADKFVQEGTIVSTRGRSAQEDYNYSAHKPGTWRVPLVVLIDGNSASASEIFAGAIRDHRRGSIVGVRSYGKGSVQGIFPLNFGGAGIRLTTAKFFSPGGRPISEVGVQPDIVVRHAAKATDSVGDIPQETKDLVLEAGLGAARRQLASR